jgi:hypothetical protein
VDDVAAMRVQEYAQVYDQLLGAAARLDVLRRLEGGGGEVDAHATAAMHAAAFDATILRSVIPDAPPTGLRHDSERLLHLAAAWREAALDPGEFIPPRPDLRLVRSSEPAREPPTGDQ